MSTRAALLVTGCAVAGAAHADGLEVGGYAGVTRTRMYQTFDCPPPMGGDFDCVSGAFAHARRHGFALGAFARISVLPAMRLQVDVAYVQKGYEVTQPTFHVDYLEAPLLVRFEPTAGHLPVRLFVVAGLAPAVRVRCRDFGDYFMVGRYSVACGDYSSFTNPPDPIRAPDRFDLGGVLGGGIGVELGGSVIEVEFRYERSLIDIGAWGSNTKNEGAYVLAGWGMRLGH
jgi:hypothetical protein